MIRQTQARLIYAGSVGTGMPFANLSVCTGASNRLRSRRRRRRAATARWSIGVTAGAEPGPLGAPGDGRRGQLGGDDA